MKIIGRLAATAAIALATVTGAATVYPSAAVAAPPWAEDVTYWLGGVAVGGKRYYCDGRIREWGETGNYEYETWNVWFQCPA